MIEVGMILSKVGLGPSFTIEVTSIDGDDVHGIVHSETGRSWQNTWNILNLEDGMKSGEYIEVLL